MSDPLTPSPFEVEFDASTHCVWACMRSVVPRYTLELMAAARVFEQRLVAAGGRLETRAGCVPVHYHVMTSGLRLTPADRRTMRRLVRAEWQRLRGGETAREA